MEFYLVRQGDDIVGIYSTNERGKKEAYALLAKITLDKTSGTKGDLEIVDVPSDICERKAPKKWVSALVQSNKNKSKKKTKLLKDFIKNSLFIDDYKKPNGDWHYSKLAADTGLSVSFISSVLNPNEATQDEIS